MKIREATTADFEAIWPIFHEIVSVGETYPYPPDTTHQQAYQIWMEQPHKTFVVEAEEQIVGTYYIKKNQPGLGSHVCNCGYMVSPAARDRGLATAMCLHSQQVAVELGYKAMQFNLVVAANEVAVNLWQKLGFQVVGRVPRAFNHKSHGFVDALVMYKWLAG
ncbi:MAG: GNAT family N-acetyltransferase [Anaerolineae bacterium]|nr:GNAT family N-acetyltransferase [Anaerolineae bacterium]